jgi:hypothetical protein
MPSQAEGGGLIWEDGLKIRISKYETLNNIEIQNSNDKNRNIIGNRVIRESGGGYQENRITGCFYLRPKGTSVDRRGGTIKELRI